MARRAHLFEARLSKTVEIILIILDGQKLSPLPLTALDVHIISL